MEDGIRFTVQGGQYFIPRPGWTDSEPLDGISAAGSELARWSPARWFGLRQVTAQFPRPIYPAEARGAFPSATAPVAHRRRRHGGDELAARREAADCEDAEASSSGISTLRLRLSVHVYMSFQFSPMIL